MTEPTEPATTPEPKSSERPWPMSWILIIILAYIAAQIAYFIFFAKA
jgi:hypothetical protein